MTTYTSGNDTIVSDDENNDTNNGILTTTTTTIPNSGGNNENDDDDDDDTLLLTQISPLLRTVWETNIIGNDLDINYNNGIDDDDNNTNPTRTIVSYTLRQLVPIYDCSIRTILFSSLSSLAESTTSNITINEYDTKFCYNKLNSTK